MKIIGLKSLICCVFLLGLFSFVNVQENNAGTIKLEQEEVTIFDETGKEIKKVMVRESGNEKEEILKEVQGRILKKLGASSIEELEKKGLKDNFRKEVNSSIKVRRLDVPKLKFLDNKGKVIKEILMESKTEVTEWTDNERKKRKLEKFNYSFATLNNNSKYVGLTDKLSEMEVVQKEDGSFPPFYGMGRGVTKFSLFDYSGRILWRKEFSKERSFSNFSDVKISDNGETTAIYTELAEEGGGKSIVNVFDKNGNEVLKIGDDGKVSPYPDFDLSPNGKYLVVRVRNFVVENTERTSIIFYNLKNKHSWNFGKDFYVCEISDDGIVKLGSRYAGEERQIVDLKKHLGD